MGGVVKSESDALIFEGYLQPWKLYLIQQTATSSIAPSLVGFTCLPRDPWSS
jgi:hypothetical protein